MSKLTRRAKPATSSNSRSSSSKSSSSKSSSSKSSSSSSKPASPKPASSSRSPSSKAAASKARPQAFVRKTGPMAGRIPTGRRVSSLPEVLTSAAHVQALAMSLRAQGQTIGFVPTMGALHDGHVALMREARQRADVVFSSIFVNPLQFGQHEDLARYPRDLEADRALCATAGVDYVFAPTTGEVYPDGFDTSVLGGATAKLLEGLVRPGHFDGVLTVVSVLFHVVQPHFAVFGEKDYQQLTLIRRMVRDLRFPVEIVPMPVIRDVDGLALSSRNAFLTKDERGLATVLYRALMSAQDAAQSGERDGERLLMAARAVLDLLPQLTTEYVELRDPTTLQPTTRLDKPARLLLAGRLGKVRLIDNGPVFPIARRDG